MSGDIYATPRIATVQAAPVFMNRDATIDKMEALTKEAKENGADLVVFPEAFIPTFPTWCLVLAPIDQHSLFERLYKNSIICPSPAFYKLGEIARKYKIFLSVGINEKSKESMGAMWNTNVLFDREGKLLNKHRKLLPTWAEKLVWSFGDGSGLRVVETEIGRIGALICGENTNTLARYSMIAQGEQIHIASYPPAWPIKRASKTASGGYPIADVIRVRTAAHSFEAKVFSVASSGYLDEEAIQECSLGDPDTADFLRNTARPPSMIINPEGQLEGDEPILQGEGICYADIDINKEISLKGVHDIVGAYQRFDIFQVNINRTPFAPARFYDYQKDQRPPMPYVDGALVETFASNLACPADLEDEKEE